MRKKKKRKRQKSFLYRSCILQILSYIELLLPAATVDM